MITKTSIIPLLLSTLLHYQQFKIVLSFGICDLSIIIQQQQTAKTILLKHSTHPRDLVYNNLLKTMRVPKYPHGSYFIRSRRRGNCERIKLMLSASDTSLGIDRNILPTKTFSSSSSSLKRQQAFGDAKDFHSHGYVKNSRYYKHFSTALFSSSSADIKSSPKDKNDNDKSTAEFLFEELKKLSAEIQQHDKLYYTPGSTPTLTDDEYDALTRREAEICIQYPDILQRLEEESEYGKKVTRYGGRVGPIITTDDEETADGVTTQKSDISVRGSKIIHLENAPMQSLDNAMENVEVVKWINRVRKLLLKSKSNSSEDNKEAEEETLDDRKTITILAEPKMDGLSLSLRYRLEGEEDSLYVLESGATRGDGKKGEDVTEAIMTIGQGDVVEQGKIPLSFHLTSGDFLATGISALPDIIEVRGEVVLPKSTFQKLVHDYNKVKETIENDDEEETATAPLDSSSSKKSGSLSSSQFSNARNAASGILLRRKSQDEMTDEEIQTTKTLRESLRFYAYSIATSSSYDEGTYRNGEDLRKVLQGIGFSIPNPCIASVFDLNIEKEVDELDCAELFQYHDGIQNSRDTQIDDIPSIMDPMKFDFDIDGAVYKVSSVEDRVHLGK